jgi:hypothetical protein
VVCERGAAHPGHRCLGRSLRGRSHHSEIGIEVATLDTEPATTRPLNGDTGVLSRTSAVELRPEVLGPCTHRAGRAALMTALPGGRPPRGTRGSLCQVEEAVDVVTPLPQGVGRGRLTRGTAEQLPGCHERPIRCGHRLATEASAAARCGAARAALDVGRWETCGVVDATSSPNRRSL